jgi:hypothetical protein
MFTITYGRSLGAVELKSSCAYAARALMLCAPPVGG